MLKTAENLKLKINKMTSEIGFTAYNSKGVDKNGAKCNVGFGRVTEICPEGGATHLVVLCLFVFFLKRRTLKHQFGPKSVN